MITYVSSENNLGADDKIRYIWGLKGSDSARPKCSPDILSGQHSPCSDILKYFRTNDESIISFKVYL